MKRRELLKGLALTPFGLSALRWSSQDEPDANPVCKAYEDASGLIIEGLIEGLRFRSSREPLIYWAGEDISTGDFVAIDGHNTFVVCTASTVFIAGMAARNIPKGDIVEFDPIGNSADIISKT
jgi:hypothetical protein